MRALNGRNHNCLGRRSLFIPLGVVNTLAFEPGYKFNGQTSNGSEALIKIRTLHPKKAVVDTNLPGMNGQQITQQEIQDKLSTRIILLAANDDQKQIIHATCVGAGAYFAKDIDPCSPFHPPSHSELMVLASIVKEMSQKETTSTLGISHQFDKNQVSSLLRNFRVEERT